MHVGHHFMVARPEQFGIMNMVQNCHAHLHVLLGLLSQGVFRPQQGRSLVQLAPNPAPRVVVELP